MKPFQADESIYGRWDNGKLVLILTTHVDDLKGGCVSIAVTGLFEHLEEQLVKGKVDYDAFEHCGMKYSQSEDRKKITIDMAHCVQQLRPITPVELSFKQGSGSEDGACAALVAKRA